MNLNLTCCAETRPIETHQAVYAFVCLIQYDVVSALILNVPKELIDLVKQFTLINNLMVNDQKMHFIRKKAPVPLMGPCLLLTATGKEIIVFGAQNDLSIYLINVSTLEWSGCISKFPDDVH